jgi:hypothetical protein
MLRLLRRWFKKRVGTGLPFFPRPLGRSRFLEGRFKELHTSSPSRRTLRRELGYRLYLPSGSSRRDS